MRPRRATAPDPIQAAAAAYAVAACDACGVELGARLYSGEIVDVYRGLAYAPVDGGAKAATPVAVKLIRERWRGHRGAIELIAREHRALESIRHPHVIEARCFAERDGTAALVTEFLPGGDLVPLAGGPARHWLPAARAVASALGAVHAAGFVHGDVKARNVLFDADGRAKLVDFGSAERIGARRGTGGRTRAHQPLRFELSRASPVEDAYALAVLLYELLAGRLPFGPEPAGWARPAPLAIGASRGLEPLAARVTASLEAAKPADVVTLIEFADVLESVHGEAVGPA